MKLTLNKEKTGMLFIDGVHNFTHAEPGPIEIDPSKLSYQQFSQVKGNIIKGLLLSPDAEQMLSSPVPIVAAVLTVPEIKSDMLIVNRDDKMKLLLNGTIPTVRKNILALAIGDVRKLIALEKKGKNRKSIISDMQKLLKTNEESVRSTVGNVDLENITKMAVTSRIRGGLDLKSYLANVGEVIESEKTEIVIKTTDDKG